MRRIVVYGVTGSGKSTLAQQIAARLGLTYPSMDDLPWEPLRLCLLAVAFRRCLELFRQRTARAAEPLRQAQGTSEQAQGTPGQAQGTSEQARGTSQGAAEAVA